MKYIITLLIFMTIGNVLAQDDWSQKDSVNGPPRSSCASFVLDGEGFVVGGVDAIEFKRKMYSYDVDQDDWDNEVSIGGENGSSLNRGSAIGFAAHNKGYVGLGQGNSASFLSDLWEYDPETESWSQKASFIGSARRQAVAFTINEIAYVGTGQDANGFTKDFYKYDATTNTWTQISDFGGSARKGAAGFTMGGQGYVGTGDEGIYVNDFWQYQPSTDTWTEKALYPGTPRTGASGWGIFPTAFIACGYDNQQKYKRDVWEYNYFSDTWQERSNYDGVKRSNATAFVIDGVAYLGLGYNGEFLDDFWCYDERTLSTSNNDNSTFKVYPNPATNQFTINVDLNIETNNIMLYNTNGQDVSHLLTINKNGNSINVQLNDLPKGLYFYTIIDQNNSNPSGKLIVE